MERWEREQILGQWGVRDPAPHEQAAQRKLAEDLDGSPLEGKPLRRRLRNFTPGLDRYVTSLGGPLPYMVRLREIHDETLAHEAALERAWLDLAAACRGDAGRFARRWRAVARRWNFTSVNELIERHNRWFPAEARLPMDPSTGDFVPIAGEPYHRSPLDAGWIFERFPPTLELARSAA